MVSLPEYRVGHVFRLHHLGIQFRPDPSGGRQPVSGTGIQYRNGAVDSGDGTQQLVGRVRHGYPGINRPSNGHVDGGPIHCSGSVVGRVFTVRELQVQAGRMRGLRLSCGTQ